MCGQFATSVYPRSEEFQGTIRTGDLAPDVILEIVGFQFPVQHPWGERPRVSSVEAVRPLDVNRSFKLISHDFLALSLDEPPRRCRTVIGQRKTLELGE
jgi:hypothetical protein